ncbi:MULTISPECIES: DUF2059 domain-containing protein [Sorangium]|uniref:DUF2059 domain-containing protein n=1 Tax=Sorangium cellulosum (strain So ce56) TaxID=448385 RepID=A9GLC2_SORC5|nr:DUF2059 domain-containing protein [Sorangium cellulosum]CAN90253.1 hypothetical protein sce0096 [Sorangium cellulosum So ce56]
MKKHALRSWIVSLAVVTLLSFVSLGSAYAGEAEKKLALELTHLVMPKDVYNALLDQLMTNMGASMQQAGAKVSARDASKLKAVVAEVLPYDELVQWNVEIYAGKFTADELKELIKFYGTPVGKKAAKLLPEISGEVGKKVGTVIVQRMPAAMKKAGIQ